MDETATSPDPSFGISLGNLSSARQTPSLNGGYQGECDNYKSEGNSKEAISGFEKGGGKFWQEAPVPVEDSHHHRKISFEESHRNSGSKTENGGAARIFSENHQCSRRLHPCPSLPTSTEPVPPLGDPQPMPTPCTLTHSVSPIQRLQIDSRNCKRQRPDYFSFKYGEQSSLVPIQIVGMVEGYRLHPLQKRAKHVSDSGPVCTSGTAAAAVTLPLHPYHTPPADIRCQRRHASHQASPLPRRRRHELLHDSSPTDDDVAISPPPEFIPFPSPPMRRASFRSGVADEGVPQEVRPIPVPPHAQSPAPFLNDPPALLTRARRCIRRSDYAESNLCMRQGQRSLQIPEWVRRAVVADDVGPALVSAVALTNTEASPPILSDEVERVSTSSLQKDPESSLPHRNPPKHLQGWLALAIAGKRPSVRDASKNLSRGREGAKTAMGGHLRSSSGHCPARLMGAGLVSASKFNISEFAARVWAGARYSRTQARGFFGGESSTYERTMRCFTQKYDNGMKNRSLFEIVRYLDEALLPAKPNPKGTTNNRKGRGPRTLGNNALLSSKSLRPRSGAVHDNATGTTNRRRGHERESQQTKNGRRLSEQPPLAGTLSKWPKEAMRAPRSGRQSISLKEVSANSLFSGKHWDPSAWRKVFDLQRRTSY